MQSCEVIICTDISSKTNNNNKKIGLLEKA